MIRAALQEFDGVLLIDKPTEHTSHDVVARIRGMQWANSLNTVALSGGCFQNKLLLEEVVRLLEADGLRCLLHAKVPSNDGGLALGQAAIAAARHINQ